MPTIREARLEDLPTLLELEQAVVEAERPFNASIKQPATYYDLTMLIAEDSSIVVVAEEGGTVIGSGYAQIRPSKRHLIHDYHGYLGFMYVAPSFRGQGVNKRVIEELIGWCRSRDIHDFYLDVYAENTAAIRAYEKVGFKPSLLEMKLQDST